jgi:hypothetical protein
MKKVLLSLFSLGLTIPALAQLPVSTSPENKDVYLEEYTGLNCRFCPDGHKKASQLATNNPGDVVIMNVHAGGFATPGGNQPDYRTPDGQTIDGAASINGYPAGSINRRSFSNITPQAGGWAMSRSDWSTAAATVLGESSYVNVGLEGDIDLNTRTLTVDVEAYFTGNGAPSSVRLNIALLQDSVLGPQVGASQFYPAMVLPDGRYVHMHMLRDMITPTWGDTISTTTMGTLFTRTYTYNIPMDYNGVPVSLKNLELVGFIAEGKSPVITAAKGPVTYTVPPGGVVTDLEVQSNTTRPATYCNNQLTPEVKVDNLGSAAASNFEVSYTLNGGTPVTQNVSSSVAAGGSTTVTFPSVTLGLGINDISYEVNTANNSSLFDLTPGNNVKETTPIVTMPTGTFGTYFYEDMESYSFGDDVFNNAIIDNPKDYVVSVVNRQSSQAFTNSMGSFGNSQQSLLFFFYDIPQGEKVSLVFEKLDLSNTSFNEIVFARAYAQYSNEDDKLEVKVSEDCGQNWTTIYSKSGSDLATTSPKNSLWGPSPSQWAWDTIRIPQYAGTPELMVKFEGVSDFGNNLFIDDIQFKNNTYVGEKEYASIPSVSVYPNPAQEQAQIEFPLSGKADVRLELTDVAGKTILQRQFLDQAQGSFRQMLDVSALPAGVYSLEVEAGGAQHRQKLIVQ